MFKLITRFFSNKSNSKSGNKSSFIRFGASVSGELEGELDKERLGTIVSWILGISIAGGGVYGISNMMRPSNAELKNPANQFESVEYFIDLEQNKP